MMESEDRTFIEKMNDNPEMLKAMLSMPESANNQLPYKARENKFSFMWQSMDMDRVEVMNEVNKAELTFIREYGDYGVPEWMLRLEAQDTLLKFIHEKFKEQGIIEE